MFGPAHKLSFSNTGNWGSERRAENSLPPPALRSDNWPTHRNHYLATLDDHLTIGSRTLFNARFSYDAFDEPHSKEFGPLGIPQEQARQRFVESLDIIRLGLSQERFSYDGEIFTVPETSIRPRPRQDDLRSRALGGFMT